MAKLDLNFKFLSKYNDFGLLILRLGLGISYITLHGWGKLLGGPDLWLRLGKNMPGFGVDEIYIIWGFLAALTETLGALLFAIGYKFRLMSFLLAITMVIAVYAQLSNGDWSDAAHPVKMLIVFVAMMFVGAGKYSVDKN